MTSLVNNLGGTAGFGEFSLARNDDGSTAFINLQSIFGTQGINFFGHNYTGLYLNNNGSVTFSAATSSFTPTAITGSTSNPIIAAYWADIDTRGGAVALTPGGTSTGTNLLWYDLDSTTHTFTATWDDVGYYNSQTNKLNAFQLSLHQINAQGDFDITFRYENVDWTTGSASGGSNGLGGTPARAGYSAGNGTQYFELPQSGNQAALLALESASNVGTPGTFVFQVRNGAPTVAISVGDASITEGNGPEPRSITIPVVLTEPSSSTVTVHYTTADGSAHAGQDYVAQSGILTFAPGVTQQNIVVAVTGDVDIEGDETFTVTLSDPSEGESILEGTATATIVDDDASLSIAATSADNLEGDVGATAFTFTVTRAGDVSGAASAEWAVTGAAADGADFADGVVPSGVVSFAAGETSKVITIAVAGDTLVEPDEAFSVTLSGPSQGVSILDGTALATIVNDDTSLSIAATSADKAEGQSGSSSFTFTVTRTGDVSGAASAEWAVTGAADGTDFADGVLPSGVVSFAAGETSKVIAVDVAGDSLVEPDEAFSVTLSNPSAGAVLGTASANGVIRNDDTSLSIAATSADKAEGDVGATAFTFTVTRSGDTSGAASVDWAVSGAEVTGSDFIPLDDLLSYADVFSYLASLFESISPGFLASANVYSYLASLFEAFAGAPVSGDGLPSGSVSFAAGETSKTVTVWALGETAVEEDESFSVTLSNASPGSVIDTSSAVGTIDNDDDQTIEDFAATELGQLVNQFFLGDGGGNAPSLKYAGADVGAGQFGAWTPLGMETVGSGYQVVWRNGTADQYIVWNVDSDGNWTGQTGVVSGSDMSIQMAELTFQQDFNADGTTGLTTTTIETSGATQLDQVANKFFLRDGGGDAPSLSYAGADVVAGQFGAWTPLGAEKAGSGYQVVWKNGGADQYIVWNVDSDGHWTSQTAVLSGSDMSIQMAELTFQQDFNADGTTGVTTTTIETSGATQLDQVANKFFLRDGDGDAPSLNYAGADVVAGQFGAWTPLGAEKAGSGYQVVWKNGGTDQYIAWNVDSDGHWTSQSGVVSGSEYAFQSLETAFKQDFNADGTIGVTTTTIETSGATQLDQVANEFFLRDGGGNGPSLKYAGTDVVADQFGAWTPIGAEKTDDGYEVAWQNGAADQYVIWHLDDHGHYSSMTDVLSGASPALETLEPTFHQDLNRDGIIG